MKVKVYNKISKDGLDILKKDNIEVSSSIDSPDAILLRSQDLHSEVIENSVIAIGRAGAGVNNIPVNQCTENGIVVFNTPGANANAVKELVIAGLLMASRDIVGGINYSKTLVGQGDAVDGIIEKNKSQFKGFEIHGKRLAVIGLGAIGVMVANAGVALGMDVEGYDPFISVDRAWGLSQAVKKASNVNKMLSEADFVTIHMPLSDGTRNFINKEKLSKFKKGSVLLNFARPEIVDEEELLVSLKDGSIGKYISDFPSDEMLQNDKVICTPHLGASTQEAEDNCAIMIAEQLLSFLKDGNITNSVNFPNCVMERTGDFRIAIINDNVPNMVGQISKVLADKGLNISEMLNKSKNNLAYTLVDINGSYTSELEISLKNIPGIKKVRIIKKSVDRD